MKVLFASCILCVQGYIWKQSIYL